MNAKLKCYIVDDDPAAVELLTEFIGEVPRLELEGSYQNPITALTELKSIDEEMILFLDVDMPNISGLLLAEQLKSTNHHVIFTTGHSQYALPAWTLNAAQFLLKPFDLADFIVAISNVLDKLQPAPVLSSSDYLFVKTSERGVLNKILKSKLIYVQGAGNYVDLFLTENRFTVYMMLWEIEDLLGSDPDFYRVHRSYIINMNYVETTNGNLIFLHNKEHKVTMSGEYRTQFQEHLKTRTLISRRLT